MFPFLFINIALRLFISITRIFHEESHSVFLIKVFYNSHRARIHDFRPRLLHYITFCLYRDKLNAHFSIVAYCFFVGETSHKSEKNELRSKALFIAAHFTKFYEHHRGWF